MPSSTRRRRRSSPRPGARGAVTIARTNMAGSRHRHPCSAATPRKVRPPKAASQSRATNVLEATPEQYEGGAGRGGAVPPPRTMSRARGRRAGPPHRGEPSATRRGAFNNQLRGRDGGRQGDPGGLSASHPSLEDDLMKSLRGATGCRGIMRDASASTDDVRPRVEVTPGQPHDRGCPDSGSRATTSTCTSKERRRAYAKATSSTASAEDDLPRMRSDPFPDRDNLGSDDGGDA